MKTMIYTRNNQVFEVVEGYKENDKYVEFIGFEITTRDKRKHKIPWINVSKVVVDEIEDWE